MFCLKAAFCRVYQAAFRIALPFLPYREPEIVPSCGELGGILKKEKITSVLIVTDKGIVSAGLIKPIENILSQSGVSGIVYDKTLPNPTVENVEEALALFHSNACNAIVAVGGGSSMDCAKAVGARVAYPKRTVNRLGGKLKVWRKLPVLIAVPTTAGTGSEATLAAMITDPASCHKYAIMSFPLIPRYAILDAGLTCSLPPHITAATGVDALVHAVEAYIGRSTTAETRRLSLEATRLIFENIRTAYSDGSNCEAREKMLHAAYKAGRAFSISYVGYIHAVAHSLGGRYGTPHGLANAVLMPYVLEAYGRKIFKKLYRLGLAAGVCDAQDTYETGALKFIEALKKLNESLGIPDKLAGIKKEDIESMARYAEKEANPLYPVPALMTRRQLEGFYCKIADWGNQNDK